jgi:hypothetical protein
MDSLGKEIVPFVHDVLNYRDSLLYVKRSGKWGLLSMNGKALIPCAYDDIRPYTSDFAAVCKNGKWGFLNTYYKESIVPQYEDVSDHDGGVFTAKQKGKWGLVDLLNKNWGGFVYDTIIPYRDETLYRAKKGGKWGAIANDGKVVIPFLYEGISMLKGAYVVIRDNKVLLLTQNNNPFDTSEYNRKFYYDVNGLARVENPLNCFIDRKGNIKLALYRTYTTSWGFYEGLCPVMKNNKWGYINSKGEEVIPFNYDTPSAHKNGYARVAINGLWGFVDATGNLVVPCIYKTAWDFEEGLAAVENDAEKFGFIDVTGKTIIPFIFGYSSGFKDGYAEVMDKDSNSWYINKKGECVPYNGKECNK